MLKLTGLQLIHALELHFGHVVAVHIHEDILDHDDAQFDLLPGIVNLLEELIVSTLKDLIH